MKIRNTILIALFAFLIYPVSADSLMRERVYLHTDKQTYLSGELLWMKFYLTDEVGKPSSFSKIGYVELVDESTAQVQVKLDVKNGVSGGWMDLPVTLPTGNYRLIAYTRNMRNEGDLVFFDKTIGVINTFKSGSFVSADTITSDPVMPPDVVNNNISVATAKQSYSLRDKGEILIKDLPENVHSLSVSVAGRDFIQGSENILTWNNGLVKNAKLPVSEEFLPEYEGHIINCNIVASAGLPLAEDRIFSLLGFVGDQVRVFGGMTSDNKNVQFFTRNITGAQELAVSTVSLSGNNYNVNIESPFVSHPEKDMPEFVLNPEWKDGLLKRSVGMQVQYAYSLDLMSLVDTTYSYFQWKPDRSYILDEYTRFTSMEELVIEFIPALRFRRYDGKVFLSTLLNSTNTFSLGSTLVLLDGIPIMDHKIIHNYNPLLVYKIDVYRDVFVFGDRHYEGLVFITTYNRDYPSLEASEATHLFDYDGTQLHRYFYSPSYTENSDIENKIPDYRHTLLWMPEVDPDGQSSLSLPFSTSDLTGDFQITVEGITKDGKVIRGTSFFDVKKP